jgi:acyl-CoA synthetase (AMP-forming)/AMP-acid ligase II
MNIFDPIFFQAAQSPSRPALGFPGGFLTYGQLASTAAAIAEALVKAGFRPGQLVAVEIANPTFHIISLIALGRLGIPTVSIPTADDSDYAQFDIQGYIGTRQQSRFATGKRIIVDDRWFLLKLQSQIAVPWRGADCEPTDICRLSVSSGTTGRPKGIALSYRNLELRLSRVTINAPGMRTLSMLGLTTAWGFLIMLRTLRTGGIYCMAPLPDDILDLAMLIGIRDIWCSSAQFASLVRAQGIRPRSLPLLENVTVGGSSVSPLMVAEATRILCRNIIMTYGATETGPVASAPAERIPGLTGAVGFTFPWIDIEIVDDEDRPVGFGQEGIVRMAGPEVISGYVGVQASDEAGEGAFRDGYFYPGDIGLLHADGLLQILGRTTEVINRGGVKVAPILIEDALRTYPGIIDAAAVIGHDSRGAPEIWAAVVGEVSASEAELIAHVRPKLLDATPTRIRRAKSIPRNALGKILRAKVLEELANLSTP